MKEIFESQVIEKEEMFSPLEKGYCPECKKQMTKLKNSYKCFKCGIEIQQ